MAVYDQQFLKEQNIFGTSRLGTYKTTQKTKGERKVSDAEEAGKVIFGNRTYEMTNHLGSVMAMVSDRVNKENGAFDAVVISAQDYYPYGLMMEGRRYLNGENSYRYGFQGMEKDDEISGNGNWLSFGDYGYMPRLGRRPSPDPKANQLPGVSPYSYALNNPIYLKDPDGELPIIPFLLKASAAAATDVLLQASMIFLTDDNVESFSQAFTKVDKTDVALSFLEGLNPFKISGGALGEAAAIATGDLLIGLGEKALAGEELTAADAGKDFLIGFFSQLAGDQASKLLSSKAARKKLRSLLGDKVDKIEVFRVFGGDADADGFSFTTKNPNNVSNFRDVAGLPSGGKSGANNTGRFVLEGTVDKSKVIKERNALPLDGNKGGLKELIINPKDVKNTRVSGANPDF